MNAPTRLKHHSRAVLSEIDISDAAALASLHPTLQNIYKFFNDLLELR